MTLPELPACVGLIGDVHAEDELLDAALAYFEVHQVDTVLCVGDVADGCGSVERCCELLEQHRVQTVRGNHDRWLFAGTLRDLPDATDLNALPVPAREFLGNLAATQQFSTALGGLLLCHGLGGNDMAEVGPADFGYALDNNFELQTLMRDPRYRFVVNGHTHRAMVLHFSGLTVINAGTLRRGDDPGFLLIDFAGRHIRKMGFRNNREILLLGTEPLQGSESTA